MAATDGVLRHDAPPSAHPGTHAFLDAVQRLPGRIFVSWSMAGGLVAGGFLVAASTLTGRSSSSAIPQLTNLFFVVGAGAGLAHGGLLCYLSRDPARTRAQVMGTLLRALVWLVPGLLLSWVAALWVSLTAAVMGGSSPAAFGMVWLVASWIFGVGVCAWAALNGVRGAVAALRRWPDVRIAAVVMSLVFAVLVTRFLASPPEIWFTPFRVTTGGAVILAFGASVWVALPVMIALLGLAHRVFAKD